MILPKLNDLKILLLENIHTNAVEEFKRQGFAQVELLSQALDQDQLIQALQDVHILGIRSNTKVNAEILLHAPKLISVGCFCIGTNQVDLGQADKLGISVFNSPFSNTRSVAELVIGEIIMLMRGIFMKSMKAHQGEFLKSAHNSFEIRGKKIGIIGYGNIGSQVGQLAELLGMQVYFYDIIPKLALGNNRRIDSMEELLKLSDVITLHVPGLPTTKNLITAKEFALMKNHSYFLNLSRGDVVDLIALKKYMTNGKILGAAIDVFPQEPKSKNDKFINDLQGDFNIILTPHIGGSTLEAQANIGLEVAKNISNFINKGSLVGAVNLKYIRNEEDVHKYLKYFNLLIPSNANI